MCVGFFGGVGVYVVCVYMVCICGCICVDLVFDIGGVFWVVVGRCCPGLVDDYFCFNCFSFYEAFILGFFSSHVLVVYVVSFLV